MDTFQSYKLQLNNFEKGVSTTWRSLQMERHFHDVTIACDDTEIKAHKIILSSNSDTFKNILSKNQHPHPVIYLVGVKQNELSHLINFIYQGEINIEQSALSDLLSVAEDLKIRGLTKNEREENISLKWSESKLSLNPTNQDKVQNRNVIKEEECAIIEESTSDKITADPKIYWKPSFSSKIPGGREAISPTFHQLEREENINTSFNESLWKYFDSSRPPGNTLKNAFVQCNICRMKIQSFTSELIDHISEHRVKGEIPNQTYNNSERDIISTETKFSSFSEKNIAGNDTFNPIEIGKREDGDFVDMFTNEIMATDESKHADYSLKKGPTFRRVQLQLESCDKCEYTPKNRGHLKEHKESVHSKIRYPCDLCNYEARLQRRLKIHKAFKHEGINYPCDMCKYKSPTQAILKDHKQRCQERKLAVIHPCDICSFESKSQKVLNNHKKIKH